MNYNSIFRETKLILATHVMTTDSALIHFSTAKMFQLMKRKYSTLDSSIEIRTKICGIYFIETYFFLGKWNVQFGQDEVVSRLFLNITKITINA